jgi:hypothetical protein
VFLPVDNRRVDRRNGVVAVVARSARTLKVHCGPFSPGGGDGGAPAAEGATGAPVGSPDQPVEQAVPLSAKEDGLAVLPLWLAWKPMPIEPPAGIAAL